MMCSADVGFVENQQPLAADRVKFLCSFGGIILPRPSDGKLRYAGGETRIVAVGRDIGYGELILKLGELCENGGFCLKYQQPDDDLDALVSVMSDEDFCHMMEEYEKLETNPGVSGRLRLFLFPMGEKTFQQQQENLSSSEGNEEQRYVEALNSVAEINGHQIENDKNNNSCISSNNSGSVNTIDNNLCSNNNNCNINSKDNSLLVGNGSEPGVAKHISAALPVSLMKPFSKGFGGSPTSPPSSPSHHHLYSQQQHHQNKQIVSPELYFRKQSGHHHIHYVHNNNLGQPEVCCDVQGQSHHYLSHSESQHHDRTSKGQHEHHVQYTSPRGHMPLRDSFPELSDISNLHHHHMPTYESFQNMQGLGVLPKGNPEQQDHYHMPQQDTFSEQSDNNSHHHYHMPRRDSFQNTQGHDLLSKGHLDHHTQQHGHHHGEELHGQEAYRESSSVLGGVEVPLKGQVEVDSRHLHLSPSVQSNQGIQTAAMVEFPSKGQYEGGSYHMHLSQRVESHQGIQAAPVVEFPLTGQYEAESYHQQDVATLSRVEFPMKSQPEVSHHLQHSLCMQSNVVGHFQHGPTNIIPQQQETYWETDIQPGVEFPHKGESNVDRGIHAGFVASREYRQSMVDTFVTDVESRGDLKRVELQHVSVQSEVAANVYVGGDGKVHNIPSRQCNLHCPTCYGQQAMPHKYHQATQSSSSDHHDQKHNSNNRHSEFAWSNSTHRRPSLNPVCSQSEQVQLMQNNNELHQGAFIDHKFMYRDQHELVQSNLLRKNGFPHSMVGHVEQQISGNDVEIERSWNASYYASSPQISHGFGCIPHSGNVMDFHLSSMSTAHLVSSGNTHERYVENQHYMEVPLAPDEHGNKVDYIGNGNMASLTYRPSPNNYVSSDNHIKWHDKPHFSEKDIGIQGHNLSHLQKTFEGNHLCQWQYDGVQSCKNRPEVWVPISFPEQSLLYSDQYGEYAQYYPVASEELPIENLRVDQTRYTVQPQDEVVDPQDGQEKVRERVLHLMNDEVDQLRMFVDVKANGVPALGRSTHNIIGQNDTMDYYSSPYQGVNPDGAYHITETDDFHKHSISNQYERQMHKALPPEVGAGHGKFVDVCTRDNLPQDMESLELGNGPQSKLNNMVIETHMACTFGLHLDSNNAQKHDFHIVGEDKITNSALGEDVQRMEHDYILHGINTSNVTNVPDYMPKDVSKKNTNSSDGDSHGFIGSHFVPEIEFLTAEPVKKHAHFESETGIPCVSNAFATAEKNQIPSSGSFSKAVTSTVAPVPDKPTIQVLSTASPYVSSSSPKRSDNMTSTALPIYDKTPSNSMTAAALPENFWSETEEGRKLSELDKNITIENKTVMSNTAQLAAEHNSIDLQEAKQDENVYSSMHQNHLNKGDGNCCASRPVAFHLPSISSISDTTTSKNLKKQKSDRNDIEGEPGMDCKELKDEDMLCTSCVEENIPQQEDTENPLGLDDDTNSNAVDMARKSSIEAEAEALAKDLQTIRNADLEEIRELGSGTYGTVYYGKWKGSDVAIKRIKASCFEGSPSQHKRLIADFWKEASILSQLHHPNVVSFYGVVRDGPGATLATVTEFMVNGSLKQVLRKKDRTIDRRKRLILAMDAAFGMGYLHEKNIVHFDLKCENLLVNMRDPHRPICKIGDMGLSKVKHQTLVSGGVRGTLPWMAPELLSGKSSVSNKIDVYSFGIVMWELLTGDEPYSNMHCGSIIGGIMKNTLRPPIPDWCEPAWRSLMERCWSADPEGRPSFSEISKELRVVAASMNVK